jgi:hypothetical protein
MLQNNLKNMMVNVLQLHQADSQLHHLVRYSKAHYRLVHFHLRCLDAELSSNLALHYRLSQEEVAPVLCSRSCGRGKKTYFPNFSAGE